VDLRRGWGSRRRRNLWPRDILCNESFPFSFSLISIFVYRVLGLSLSYLCEMPPPTFLSLGTFSL
jgi:hypothetical protein